MHESSTSLKGTSADATEAALDEVTNNFLDAKHIGSLGHHDSTYPDPAYAFLQRPPISPARSSTSTLSLMLPFAWAVCLFSFYIISLGELILAHNFNTFSHRS